MSTQPTDADLEHLYQEETGFSLNESPAALLDFARAVLAKWGTPAGAEDPFCWHWENTFNGGTGAVKKNPETLGINMSHPDYKWTALYTAQQPTTAQAASSAVLKAIREANMQLVRTGDDAFMLVPYKAVTAQAADSVQEDAARLDFIERHPEMSLRHRKGRWAFLGFTNYEYEMLPSLRAAIDAARKQGEKQ